MSEHTADLDAGQVRALADDPAVIDRMANFVPLGFIPDKDPYANVQEAARAFLLGLAEYLDETRVIPSGKTASDE